MKKTPTGLAYKDLTVGTGATAASGKQVEIHYVGQLTNGTIFDSNRDGQPPLTFVLGAHRVVDGFDQGIMGMKVGGKRLIMIPPALGYGAAGNGPVPPNAVMVFTLDLVSVK